MLKWLLVAVVVAGVWYFFIKKKPISSNKQAPTKKKKYDEDEMVECKKCGTYVSLDEVLIDSGNYYCSKECI